VVVDVLDVNDEEAGKLLLSLDPLSQLANYDPEAVNELRRPVSTNCEMLATLWEAIIQVGRQSRARAEPKEATLESSTWANGSFSDTLSG
jgi:hypothetical protein